MSKSERPKSKDSGCVTLNIGGKVFRTFTDTLMKGTTMLSAMFSGRIPVKKEEDGSVFIDRDGTHFRYILNFLRDGTLSRPDTLKEIDELKAEARFYCIPRLVEYCESFQDERATSKSERGKKRKIYTSNTDNNLHEERRRNKVSKKDRVNVSSASDSDSLASFSSPNNRKKGKTRPKKNKSSNAKRSNEERGHKIYSITSSDSADSFEDRSADERKQCEYREKNDRSPRNNENSGIGKKIVGNCLETMDKKRHRRSSSSSSNERSEGEIKERDFRQFRDDRYQGYGSDSSGARYDKRRGTKDSIDVRSLNRSNELYENSKFEKDAKNAKMKNALNIGERKGWSNVKENFSQIKNDKSSLIHRKFDSQNYHTLFTSRFKVKDGFCDDCNIPYTGDKGSNHYNSRTHYQNTSGKFRCQICFAYNSDIKLHLANCHVEDVFRCNVCSTNKSSNYMKQQYHTLEMRKMLDHFYNFHPNPGEKNKPQKLPDRDELLASGKILPPKNLECLGCKLCNGNYMCSIDEIVEHQHLEDGISVAHENDIRFTCRICGPVNDFVNYQALKRHIEDKHDYSPHFNRSRSASSNYDSNYTAAKNSNIADVSIVRTSDSINEERSALRHMRFRPDENKSFGSRSSIDSDRTRLQRIIADREVIERSLDNVSARYSATETERDQSSDRSSVRSKWDDGERIKPKKVVDNNMTVKEPSYPTSYNCFYCAEEFKTSSVRQQHMSMQHDANMFACELKCTSFTVNTRRQMLAHLDDTHYFYNDPRRESKSEYLKLYSIPPNDSRLVTCRLCKHSDYNDDDDLYDENLVGIWLAQNLDALQTQLIKHIRTNHPSKSSELTKLKQSPSFTHHSSKSGNIFPLKIWFKLGCRLCNKTFSGKDAVKEWDEHANKRHDPVDSLIEINSLSSEESDITEVNKSG